MATLDVSSAQAALKAYYSTQRVENLMYQDAPLFAALEKVKDFYGKNYPLPLKVTNPQGRSATFTNAQNQKTASVYRDFTLTRAKDYSLASISSEAIMASESNPGAFLRLATSEIDGALDSLKRSIAWSLYGDGSGSLGSISAISAANPAVITLTRADDIVKFEVGQLLEGRNGVTARIFATGISVATVAAVDRDAGTVTTNVDNSGGTATLVSGDTLNVVGDYNAKLSGLAAWIPSTAPSSTAFFGLDRTIDVTRLAGIRNQGSGKPMDEVYVDAARRIGREGGSPDMGFLGYSRYATLEKTLGSRVIYDDVEMAGVGFRGIKIQGPSRPITIMPDRDCPDLRGYLLSMETWAMYSLKEPVMILDLDGNKFLREGSADSYEVRCATFSQLATVMPGHNGVILFG